MLTSSQGECVLSGLRARDCSPSSELRSWTRLFALFWVLFALMLALPAVADPVPSVTLSADPGEPFIGQDVTLEIQFDNTDAVETGYGPFVDLVLPVNGMDGIGGVDADGIDLASGVSNATYLGVSVATEIRVFPDDGSGTGCVDHPYAKNTTGAPLRVCGTAGDKLVTMLLPFGSFVPDQPPAALELELSVSNEADLRAALSLSARAGFQFGANALDDPATDPSILGPNSGSDANTDSSAWSTKLELTPTLIRLTKSYSGPEDETATGPNFPRTYTISVDVAPEQEVTNLDVTDFLPDNMAYLGLVGTAGGTATTISQPPVGVASNPSSNELTVRFDSITGGTPATVTFEYFIPRVDANDNPVLDPETGDDVVSQNQAEAIGDWDPIDGRDTGGTDNAVADADGFEHILTDKAIAIQKSVAVFNDTGAEGPTPGDTLEYTLEVQVSDYFSLDQVVITDTLSDGQRFDASFTPVLSANVHADSLDEGSMVAFNSTSDLTENFSGDADPSTGDGDPNDDTDGSTEIRFRVSDDLAARLSVGRLTGGCVPKTGTGIGLPDCDAFDQGPTLLTVKFRAIIQDDFSDDFPSGDPSVDQGDTLDNEVSVEGQLLSVSDNSTPTGESESDNSSAGVAIAYGSLSKAIYKINESDPGSNPIEVKAGDTITYRITYSMPNSNVEQLQFIDYLPKPVLEAMEVATFDADGGIPPAGQWGFGPDDTFNDIYINSNGGAADGTNRPDLTTNTQENSLTFDYGDFNDSDDPSSRVIDLLFTVTVTDDPFADELFLTNQVRAAQNSTNAGHEFADSIVQFKLREPDLTITKDANPTSNVDAGDTVTFTITVENTGGAPAYGVTITDLVADQLDDDFTCVALQAADVTNGSGTQWAFTGDINNGIVLTDALPAEEQAVVTLTCTLDADVTPRAELTNTASVVWKASATASDSFPPQEDDASVTVKGPSISKLVDTDNVTAGDIVTYSITVTIPDGVTPGLKLTDTLPRGFEYLSGVTVTKGAFAGTVETSPTVSPTGMVADGQTLTIEFGNTTATGGAGTAENSFTVEFDARVTNDSVNDGLPSAQSKTNSVALTWDGQTGANVIDTATTAFGEPNLAITKTMSPATVDAGDTVTVTLQVTNDGTWPAYDIVVTDVLNEDANNDLLDLNTVAEGTGTDATPSGYTYGYNDGTGTVTYTQNNGTSLAAGASVTFTFTAQVKSDVVSGSTFQNSADVEGDSQEDSVTGERSTTDSDETSTSTSTAAVSKTLIASSESWTNGNTAAIGEILTYQASFVLPEGLTRAHPTEPIIVDTLPAGMVYIDGSARVHAVANTTSSINGSSFGNVTNDSNSPAEIDPTVIGQDLKFNFGDIRNNDTDADEERLVLTYQVQVLNTSANNRTNTKTNTAALNYQNAAGTGQSLTDTHGVTIVEPNPGITKTALPATVSGGDSVEFTVTFTNESDTAVTRGWEAALTDTLPDRYQNPSITSATLSRGSANITTCAEFSGQTISLELDGDCIADQANRYLGPGENITLVYSATVDPAINFEEVVTNSVTGRMTSLPGAKGASDAILGDPDEDRGERTGSGSNNTSGQAVNDLAATTTAQVTAGRPTITKTGDANLQIGQTTTMTLTVDVPVGTTEAFVVNDALPTGLRYVGDAVVTIPAGINATKTPSAPPAQDGGDLQFDFGTITNNAGSAQRITIEYEVQVRNISTNQGGDSLTNTATLSYSGMSAPAPSDTATITVVEPNLEIGKTITSGATGSDAGDTISFKVEIRNTSTLGTAYRVSLEDVLPPELLGANSGTGPFFTTITVDNDSGAVKRNDNQTSLAASDAQFSTTDLTADTLTWPPFDLPPQKTLVITYDAVVIDDAPAGATLTNDVSASYHSLVDGGEAGRDNSDDGDDDAADQANPLNNYGETGSASLTLDAELAIQKTLNATHADNNNFTIGDEILFDLRVDLVEGTVENLVITDTLPEGVEFIAFESITAGNNIAHEFTASQDVSVSGQAVSFELGTVTNTADANAANDYLVLTLRARVTDDEENANGDTLENSASLTSDNAGSAGPVTTDIHLVEPSLVLTKTPHDPTPTLGDRVTWTIQVRNQSDAATAYDVVLTDLIPAGLGYLTGSTLGATVDESNTAQPSFSFASIAPSDTKEFTFQTRVDLDASVGAAITNTIEADYGGQSGDNAEVERAYNATTNGKVEPDASAFIEATKTVSIAVDNGTSGVLDPGDTLLYSITLTNQGSETAANVIFTDSVPANTTYVTDSLTTTAGTIDASDTANLVVNVGTMEPDAVVTITFQATVNGETPAGTVISNQGSVDSDQTVPEPTDVDGNDSNGDQPTTIPVGGAPSLDNALYVEKLVEWSLDSDSNGAVTPGDTLTYTLILANRGDEELTGVTLSDDLPDGLSYVADSAEATSGTVEVSGDRLSLASASIPVGGYAFVWFEVTIDDPLVNNDGVDNIETFTNQATADSDQTDPVRSDGNGDPSDGNQPTSITAVSSGPGTSALDVEKRWSLAVDVDGDGRVDPGDTLAYRISVRNTGSAQATDVRLSDDVPDNTSLVAGSETTSQGVVVSEGDPIEVNLGTLSAGAVATVGFRVTVNGGTPDGTLIANQASVTAAGGISEQSDDNGTDDDGKNPTLTPVDTEGTSGTPSGLTKNLTNSSETDSTGANLMVGEVATFQIEVAFPAGTLRQATLSDTLPTGLSYVPGTARLARTFDDGLKAQYNPGGINSSTSGVFVALTDASELEINGPTLSLPLGVVINSDNDVDDETYTLEYQAVVANSTTNQAGEALTNSATLSYLNALNQPRSLTPVEHTATVIEPAVQIEKSVSPAGVGQFGGTQTFTVTLTNPSSGGTIATAYDVRVLDTLPADYSDLQVVSQTPAGEPAPQGITDSSDTSTLDITVAVLPPDASLTIVYQATAAAGLALDTELTNTAKATWTSLPGERGTGSATPGDSGDEDGERTGSQTGANDYAAEDDAVVTVGDVSFSKSIVDAQTRYAIGETLTYRLDIDLLPGAGPQNTAIQDQLDAGLTYVADSLSIALDSGVTKTGTATDFTRQDNEPSDGLETLSLDLGTLANSSGDVAGATLSYQARVDNLLDNQDGETRDNAASLTFDNPLGGGQRTLEGSTTLTLGEPELSLDKTITSPTTNLDAGDRIDFQVRVSNDGTTTAQDVVLTDVLPDGLETVTNLAIVATAGGAEAPTFVNDGSGWRTNPFRLPVGASVTLSFSARLTNSVLPDQSLQNRVTASFSSLGSESEHERDGSDSGSEQTDGTLNNYNTSDASPVVTVANPVQIDKTFHPDATKTTYTIGEQVDYRLRIELSEGRIDDMVVTDTLPEGLRFLSATLGLGNTGIQTNDAAPTQSGQVLNFDLGDVANPADGRTDNDFITLDIQAVVEDVLANVSGAILGNHASVSYQTASGPQSQDFDADADEVGTQPLELEIIEPVLTLEKTLNTERVALGGEVQFTLTLAHTAASRADAYDLVVTDRLPSGLSYLPDSANLPVTVAGNELTFELDALPLADGSREIRFRALVDQSAEPGESMTNVASLGFDTQPGSNEDERDYTDDASVDLDVISGPRVGSLSLQKTVYQGHDGGAGCPGLKELTVVDKNRVPMPVTWCFALSNTGTEALADPIWDDEPLFTDKPGTGQTPMTLRAGSAMPLQPGATAWYFVEEMRVSSLVNSVTVTMTPVEPDGSPIPDAEPVTDSDTVQVIFGYVYDPPFGVKVGQEQGQDIVRWTMVWVNDNVVRADGVVITDPPPAGMTMYGAPVCTPYGSTTVDACSYDPPDATYPRGRVRVLANFGPDYGVTVGTLGSAANRLEIAFDVLVDRPEEEITYENQGEAEWQPPEEDEPLETETYDITQIEELNPDLPITDLNPADIPPAESPVRPLDPVGPEPPVQPSSIPTLSEWGLILLVLLMLGLAGHHHRRQGRYLR